MTDQFRPHPDIGSGARTLHARGPAEAPLVASTESDFALFRAATNVDTSVLEILRPIVLGEDVTIVTGYASLLSVLSLVASLRPGITFAERGTVRIILGEEDRPAGRTPYPAPMTPARLRAIFLHPAGVAMSDPRDVRAATAREALRRGAIRVRVVDATKLGKGMTGLQANLIVGEDFAMLSSGGFSRRDLLERAVMADRVSNETPAYEARRKAAEMLWSAGQSCTREVGEILDALFAPVEPRAAARRAVKVARTFPLFETETNQPGISADLVGQALARVYENGFAFVRVPAGAGQSEIAATLDRRLAFNAERMIGMPGMEPWRAHVETATGARWSDARTAEVLAKEAPLTLDGTVAPAEGETEIAALYRRMKCRHRSRRDSPASGHADFEGFPELEVERIEQVLTKAQGDALTAATREVARALEGALDDASAAALRKLSRLATQSSEAALLIWRQGGMRARVRTTAVKAGGEVDQNVLPIFGGNAALEAEPSDLVGDALAARGFKGMDKTRLKRVVDWGVPTLVLVEDGLARHALARRLSDMVEAPVLGVIEEGVMREAGISGREVPYQRAETPEVAMSMLTGAEEGGPRIVVASAAQAADMTLTAMQAALVFSVPAETEVLAAGLSSIDGIGKGVERIRIAGFEPAGAAFPGASGESVIEALKRATEQMRTPAEDTHDGVADILSALEESLAGDAADEGGQSQGRVALATVESRQPFTLFALAGVAGEADSAAHPPRLLVVHRNPHSGEEEVLRNQVGCAAFLETLDLPAASEDPRETPGLPDMGILETIGRHMSHLSHWDARPERMVAALDSLAAFLREPPTSAEELFSDLCLTSLEILHDRWQAHLRESRDLASIREPGLAPAVSALRDRPVWEIDDVKADMENCLDQRIAADARRSRALHDRVVAVIHGTGEQDLAP